MVWHYPILVLLLTWSFAVLSLKRSVSINTVGRNMMLIPGLLALGFKIYEGGGFASLVEPFRPSISPAALTFSVLYAPAFVFFLGFTALILGKATLGRFSLKDHFIPYTRSIGPWVACLGEEYGWRGYLLPKMTAAYGLTNATWAVGITWGLWHIYFVFVVAKICKLKNPLRLTIIQGLATVAIAFPFSFCFSLSQNVLLALILHWSINLFNPALLGSPYTHRQGFFQGNITLINGEGVFGIFFGALAAIVFVAIW